MRPMDWNSYPTINQSILVLKNIVYQDVLTLKYMKSVY